jgi:hypothetical protein
VALMAPLTHAKPLSHSQRTSNTFTNTTLEDMTATGVAPTPTDAALGCFETYVPLPDETCGELASDYGIFLSDFEADYAADSPAKDTAHRRKTEGTKVSTILAQFMLMRR